FAARMVCRTKKRRRFWIARWAQSKPTSFVGRKNCGGNCRRPIKIMNPPESNDPLDALLREQDSYIEDNGFTARVVAALPRRRRAWLRPGFLLGAVTIGSVLAVGWLPWGNLPV